MRVFPPLVRHSKQSKEKKKKEEKLYEGRDCGRRFRRNVLWPPKRAADVGSLRFSPKVCVAAVSQDEGLPI